MEGNLLFTSAGCNRVANTLDWGPWRGLVAYGAHNAVVLLSTAVGEPRKVVATLHGHSARVNCVHWPTAEVVGCVPEREAPFLFSGDASGVLVIWTQHCAHPPRMEATATLKEHSAAITGIQSFASATGGIMVASCAGDHMLKVWTCEGDGDSNKQSLSKWAAVQSVDFGNRLPYCVSVTSLSVFGESGWKMMAVGVDKRAELLLCAPGGEFKEIFTLEGHQDWVRSVAFTCLNSLNESGTAVLLATGSQDKNIRVWRASPVTQGLADNGVADGVLDDITRLASKHSIRAGQQLLSISLEAVLIGHEDWVHSVAWAPNQAPNSPPLLLSASMDRTMMLWQPESSSSGLWMSTESVGDAGSNALGYFGGVFSPCGTSILAHGFTGALHLWSRNADGQWEAQQCVGGHFGAVVDCCWGKNGDCLFSASVDQTIRISTMKDDSWFEIARPQVHGHDFSCLAALPHRKSDSIAGFRYVSGSEEKVLRVFQAPAAFASSLRRIQGCGQAEEDNAGVVLGATVAALGLSNKAVYAGDEAQPSDEYGTDDYGYGPDMAPNPQPRMLERPPFEEELAQSTLWPEVKKVFGHGNDLITVVADPRGDHCASACRAQNAAMATIWVWNTADWSCVAKLKAHNLTVTALEYSSDGRFLLSASRDRSFSVFQRDAAGDNEEYHMLCRKQKAHERIVWGVSWAPGKGHVFATCSRDKLVKLWTVTDIVAASSAEGSAGLQPLMQLPAFEAAVTAVAFGCGLDEAHPVLAVGLESGAISIWSVDVSSCAFEKLWAANPDEAHCAAVRRLSWQQSMASVTRWHCGDVSLLASCGEDHKLRVFSVKQ